jgi:hypothetical protein
VGSADAVFVTMFIMLVTLGVFILELEWELVRPDVMDVVELVEVVSPVELYAVLKIVPLLFLTPSAVVLSALTGTDAVVVSLFTVLVAACVSTVAPGVVAEEPMSSFDGVEVSPGEVFVVVSVTLLRDEELTFVNESGSVLAVTTVVEKPSTNVLVPVAFVILKESVGVIRSGNFSVMGLLGKLMFVVGLNQSFRVE